jgi:poly(hydroxyalkanoate) depolymerase family esterase
MAGLRDTLARLAHMRRRLDGLLKSTTELPATPRGPTPGTRLSEVTGFGSNPGHLRMLAYAPRDLQRASPLVVALHGCTQTAAAYDHGSGWSTLSDRHGFALLFPEQQHVNNPNACFTWFHPADTQRDRGEVLSIRQMIERMIQDHGVDRRRVFIVGLSAGGAMTAATLAAYPELFAGGAIIAGLPYGSVASVQAAFESMAQGSGGSPQALGDLIRSASSHDGPWPKLSVWHGSADSIVNPRNAEEIVQQWSNVHGLPPEPDFVQQMRGYSRRVWQNDTGADVIEAYIISGMGHGVPLAPGDGADHCGHAGAFHLDVGLSSSSQIVKFWGIAADRPAMSFEVVGTPGSGIPLSVPARPVVGGVDVPAPQTTRAEPIAPRLDQFASTAEGRSDAHVDPFDPRHVITATLQKVGLHVPLGRRPAHDQRSIISSTLRSVGLLKE